jgi:hypothetical protein
VVKKFQGKKNSQKVDQKKKIPFFLLTSPGYKKNKIKMLMSSAFMV